MRFLLAVMTFLNLEIALASSHCEVLQSLRGKHTVCWNDTYKGWFSKKCEKENCEAIQVLKQKENFKKRAPRIDSTNPAVSWCYQNNLNIEILRDKYGYEQSFCVFHDKSMVDSNAIDMAGP